MSNVLEEKFGALLAFPWEASPSQPTEIIGQWAEDGSRYTVICPEQLRKQLVTLQVQLYAQLEAVRRQRSELHTREQAIAKVLLT
jgi:hypothetical protein